MKVIIILLSVLSMWSASFLAVAADAVDEDATSDMRVVIDISGSMKKNDPNNLRVPALRLITQLIPEGQQAGVWAFGKYVNMLVKQDKVDSAWKDNAYKAAKEINSKGLYTNIENVLEKSTWDWKRTDAKKNRSIIFLTDGVVDISRNDSENAESRSRILNKILPRLKEAGVTVHTIALSDDADKAFLRQLSSMTGGWNEIAKDASQLERIFLKLFEKSVPVETLPLKDNRVLVDDSIKELTLLIFKKEGTESATLVTPSGDKFTHKTEQKNLRWRHEKRYDLITIDEPAAGEWGVNAELDPDNRVMVVTDLKVRASRLPNVMMAEDAVAYFVELQEEGKVIRNPAFLDFVHISLDRSSKGEHQKTISLNDDGNGIDKSAGDGRFGAKVGGQLTAGVYEYEMQVDGMTFKRSKKDTVRVVEKPVAVTVKEEKSGDPAQYSLTLTPFAELIKPDSLQLEATVNKQGGGTASLNIPRAGPSEWRLDMKIKAGDIYDVKIDMQAQRLNGREVMYELGNFELGKGSVDVAFDQSDETPPDVEKPVEPEEPVVVPEKKIEPKAPPTPEKPSETPPAVEPEKEKPVEPEEEKQAPEEEAHDEEAEEEHADEEDAEGEESPNWIMAVVKIVVLNIVLFAVGFFVWRKWFRKSKAVDDEESESDDDSSQDNEEKKDEGQADDKD